MEEAGVDGSARAPGTSCARPASEMQRGGVYGAPLPYGRNSHDALIFIGFIHGAGGQIFTPDLQVAIDSPETPQRARILQVDAGGLPARRHQLLAGARA